MIEIIEKDCDKKMLNNNKGYCEWLVNLSKATLKRLNKQFDEIEKIKCNDYDLTVYYYKNIKRYSETIPYGILFEAISMRQESESEG